MQEDLNPSAEAFWGGPPPPGYAVRLFTPQSLGPERFGGLRLAAKKAPLPVQAGDLWHFGSVGKPMTSALIAALAAEGTLSFESRLADLLPLARATAYADCTLAMLLSHRAGLPTDPAFWPLLRYLLWGGNPARVSARLMARALAQKPVFPPGTDFLYSNIGYGLAGAMAATAAQAPFEALLQKQVLDRFAMKGARFGMPPQDGTAPREHRWSAWAKAWAPIKHGTRFVDDLPLLRPSGALTGRADDLARFGQAALQAALGLPGAAADLAPSFVPQGPCPEEGGAWRYALGWFVDAALSGQARLWHSGSTGGSFALLLLLPEKARGAVLLANAFRPEWTKPGSAPLEALCRYVEDAAPP